MLWRFRPSTHCAQEPTTTPAVRRRGPRQGWRRLASAGWTQLGASLSGWYQARSLFEAWTWGGLPQNAVPDDVTISPNSLTFSDEQLLKITIFRLTEPPRVNPPSALP